jgi:hypothetical protein
MTGFTAREISTTRRNDNRTGDSSRDDRIKTNNAAPKTMEKAIARVFASDLESFVMIFFPLYEIQ